MINLSGFVAGVRSLPNRQVVMEFWRVKKL